jgi:hypothetical protein
MIRAALDELGRARVERSPDVVLADAGYWHQIQMGRLVSDGLTVLVPPDAKKRAGARPGWDRGLHAFMRRFLETDAGGDLYAKRPPMIEPTFADTKFNRRIDRFLRRGRSAARSEWRLTNAAHNPLRLWRHSTAPGGHLTAPGGHLTAPPAQSQPRTRPPTADVPDGTSAPRLSATASTQSGGSP